MSDRHCAAHTNIHRRWESMLQRCYNPRHAHYDRYGGRGITVCREWRESFAAFYRDVGDPPSPQHQLDRKDNSLGYCKENCRWVTPAVNSRNRSSTKLSTEDVELLLKLAAAGVGNQELGARFGVKAHTVATMTWRANRDNHGDRHGHRDGISRYRGVSWRRRTGRWMVRIQFDYVGMFSSEEEAARAYDAEARRRFGPAARLNFPYALPAEVTA